MRPLFSGCAPSGFADEDERSKKRWDTRKAYQYIGPDGKTKYAKVLDVDTGILFKVPRTTQVLRHELVSIELQPEAGEF